MDGLIDKLSVSLLCCMSGALNLQVLARQNSKIEEDANIAKICTDCECEGKDDGMNFSARQSLESNFTCVRGPAMTREGKNDEMNFSPRQKQAAEACQAVEAFQAVGRNPKTTRRAEKVPKK